MIKIITTDFEQGQIFKGKVVSIKEFGAFVEFAPGKEGNIWGTIYKGGVVVPLIHTLLLTVIALSIERILALKEFLHSI